MERELAVCPVMFFLSTAGDRVLGFQVLDSRTVSDLGVLVLFLSALQWIIDDISFRSIFNASSFDAVLFYVLYRQSEKANWSVFDICDPIGLYDSAVGRVYQLLQEVVPIRKQARGHYLSDRPLGVVPICYHESLSLTLCEAVPFVDDILSRFGVVWQLCLRHDMVLYIRWCMCQRWLYHRGSCARIAEQPFISGKGSTHVASRKTYPESQGIAAA